MKQYHDLPTQGRGPIAIPSGDVPNGTRCISLQIPDSDDAERQLSGMLYELTHWNNYAREAQHLGTQWAQAWRAAIIAQDLFTRCEPMIQVRTCEAGCGIEISVDSGQNWTCLDLSGCIENIWDEKLAQAFDDGVLGQPGGQPGPTEPPIPGACHSFHVVLQANQQWRIPFELSSGDTVHITGLSGGWTDGTLIWYCADGRTYFATTCLTDEPAHEGDPLQSVNHMMVIGGYDSASPVFFDAKTSMFTVPAGVTNQTAWLQANDGSLTDNGGQIECNVEVCTGGWAHLFDYTQSGTGWSPWNDSMVSWTPGGFVVGTQKTGYYHAAERLQVTLPADCVLKRFILHFTGADTNGRLKGILVYQLPANTLLFNNSTTSVVSSPWDSGEQTIAYNGDVYISWIFDSPNNGQIVITGLEVRGEGTEPTW